MVKNGGVSHDRSEWGVSRFHVMAVLQAARAFVLGLKLDEAKSWGLNRALFYAAAKRGWLGAKQMGLKRPYIPEVEHSKAYRDPPYVLGGEKAYRARSLKGGLRFKFGPQIQTPEEFDKKIVGRIADWESVWKEALDIAESADRRDLDIRSRFFEHVYKPRRDQLAEKWSELGDGRKRGLAA